MLKYAKMRSVASSWNKMTLFCLVFCETPTTNKSHFLNDIIPQEVTSWLELKHQWVSSIDLINSVCDVFNVSWFVFL